MFRAAVAVGRAQTRQAAAALPILRDVERGCTTAWLVCRNGSVRRSRGATGGYDVVGIDAVLCTGDQAAAGGDAGVCSEELRDGDARDLRQRRAGVAHAGGDDKRAGIGC